MGEFKKTIVNDLLEFSSTFMFDDYLSSIDRINAVASKYSADTLFNIYLKEKKIKLENFLNNHCRSISERLLTRYLNETSPDQIYYNYMNVPNYSTVKLLKQFKT